MKTTQRSRCPVTVSAMQPINSLKGGLARWMQKTGLGARIAYSTGSAAPMFRASGPVPGYHSQIAQDYFLDRHVFLGRTEGVFVDVGAHDGVEFNNTQFFESDRRWTGVCIEPQPDVFLRLRDSRSAVCVQAAIGETPGTMPFVVGEGGAEMLSGLAASYDPRHWIRVKRYGKTKTIDVEVRRLDEVLRASKIDRVDLLSIDVEGGELGVINSIDLAAHGRPIVVMENNYRSWPQVRAMRRQGYQLLCRIDFDEVFIPVGTRLS